MNLNAPPPAKPSKMAEAAAWYASNGFPVFPLHSVTGADHSCTCGKRECSNAGKHPRTKHGFKDATTDVATIAARWEKFPEANIGIPTGEVSGLLVLDIDPRNRGDQSLTQLVATHGPLPVTAAQVTGGGGHHLVFRYPSGQVVPSCKLAPGIDLKSNGGYIVAAPSLHRSGQRYRWNGEDGKEGLLLKLAEPPAYLLNIEKTAGSAAHTPGREIPEGQRNDSLISLAGSLRRQRCSQRVIEAALLARNEEACQPPLPMDEVRAIAASAAKYPPNSPKSKHGDRRAEVISQILQSVDLFSAPDSRVYAAVRKDDHRETYPIRSRAFQLLLNRLLYERPGVTASPALLQEALLRCESEALFGAHPREVFLRVASGASSSIHLDLCNDVWEAVAVSKDGWKIEPASVHFRRSRGMLALPRPLRGGSLDEMKPFVNAEGVEQRSNWILMASWLLGCLNPKGPYPILILQGEHGSGKSTVARILRTIIDPASPLFRRPPRDERDLMIAATNNWVINFDNLSGTSQWLSDTLCSIATGGGFATRELHSDNEETLFSAQRPAILNGIDEIAVNPDLADRSIIISLPQISENRTEKEYWKAFEALHPRILGALLDAVAAALRNEGKLFLEKGRPRMADFAEFVCAAADALPFSRDEFVEAYTQNREEITNISVEASPLATAVAGLVASCARLDGSRWEGTAAKLLDNLNEITGEEKRKSRTWPKDVRSLGNGLRRIQPLLRRQGVEVQYSRFGKNRERIISLSLLSES